MRFDDSLETVLSAERTSSIGAQTTWRQLVDLVGRGRAGAPEVAIRRLREIRAEVPARVRAASARGLAYATPPALLVAMFAEDEIAVSAPVLRAADLETHEWTPLLAGLSPAGRSILRHRRDLPAGVQRALESFGSVDFVLSGPAFVAEAEPMPAPVADVAAEAEAPVVPQTIPAPSPFVSIAAVAAGLPVVAEALRRAEQPGEPLPAPVPAPVSAPVMGKVANDPAIGPFPIAELVARIDAYQRRRDALPQAPSSPEIQSELFAHEPAQAQAFRFETDAAGVIRWVEGAARAPLIGLSLDLAGTAGAARVDGVAGGAFRRRAGFSNARLLVDGQSDAAGAWRITGTPVFDRASGRFNGYRGTARRPRADESAEPVRGGARGPVADALRQLAHELRTPTNAIAGFAEMIEAQMLGPVPAAYRAHAATIRSHTNGLLGAIDDIDMAARIESQALDLRAGDVPVAPLLERIVGDLAPLADLRGAVIALSVEDDRLAIAGDDRAVERLVARMLATLVAAAAPHERIGIAATRDERSVRIVFDRPASLADYSEAALLTIDAETEAARDGAPLLGTGFALRLARNLAAELHGSLTIDAQRLTLRLPAAEAATMEQVSSS